MAFLDFGPDIRTGIALMDEHHEQLFTMVNDLHAATMAGAERSTLESIFNGLIDYTVYHFQAEEELMIKADYADRALHQAEHNRLIGQAVQLQQQFQDGSATISFDLLDFLHDWLLEHTSGIDRHMASLLKDSGIT